MERFIHRLLRRHNTKYPILVTGAPPPRQIKPLAPKHPAPKLQSRTWTREEQELGGWAEGLD
jgi:hypothetical protein